MTMKRTRIASGGGAAAALSLAVSLGAVFAPPALAADGLVTVRQLSPETALKAAQAALLHCRARGYSVGVAVVDRAGLPQAFLRDRFGGAHTFDTALNKAWTSASFRTPTTVLATETQAGKPSSGIRQIPRVAALGGGMTIEAAGAVVGAIGVSGAPSGEADDECAKAGIRAIQADIEL
ncbi:MAG TPA: heme-binding protein [Quisquiliibacterium sp.]|nr:heme-binding protein [Quisquiliibacterium sp.]